MKHIHLIGLPRSGTTYLFQLGRVAITHLQDEIQQTLNTDRWSMNESFNVDHLQEPINIAHRCHFVENNTSPLMIKSHIRHFTTLHNHVDILDRILLFDSFNIMLYRRNVIDTILSYALAVETDNWTVYNDVCPVEINEHTLVDLAKFILTELDKLLRNPYNIKFDKIIAYEDLKNNLEEDTVLLFDGTNIDYRIPTKMPIEIQQSPDKRTRITNYNECKQIIHSTLNTFRIENAVYNIENGIITLK